MSQLGCVSSGNNLQRQKKGPWSLGKRKTKKMCLGEGEWGRHGMLQRERERVCTLGKEGVEKAMGVLKRERAH